MLYKSNHKKGFWAFSFSLALFLGTETTVNAMSQKAVISTYQGVNGPWQLLEYIFISNVQNSVEHFQKHSFAALGIAGTSFLAKVFLYDAQKNASVHNDTKTNNSTNSEFKNLAIGLSALAAGKTAYDYATCVVKRNVQYNTLLNLLNNWDMYRVQLPTSLVEYFDELAECYQANGEKMLTNSLITEVFELVTHHIEHHFESRYKKSDDRTNTIEAFKSCTSIWDNLK